MNNHKCKVCGYSYHHCSSCDSGGIPWEADGFCSGDCYYGWAQGEIERLHAFRRAVMNSMVEHAGREQNPFAYIPQQEWEKIKESA
jgi:hypothetical protein